ncbi:hypothetical protein Tco_1112802 [Tanacetum coccineum]|uniref:Uncharacterized protein n=1 Tax=Tanacetum coccineum TaxID=301880 RepID=A0ABQ5IQP5_9ASTR
MDNLNITMEEYIRLQEDKALSRGETFNWQTATYGKMEYCEDEDDCFTNFETKFPAIILDNTLTSDAAISCGPTVSPLNDNEINFRISFDESDDEDYTPEVSYFNDLDFFKDFENEFPAIVYNDALTSKLDLLTEPTISPRHIDEFDLKDETSLSECDEEEQNILYFNDLFSFNVIYPDDLKSDTNNDNDKIDIEQPSGDMSVIPLPNNYDTEREKYNKAKLENRGYERALESLEARILGNEKNELAWGERYEFQNYDLKCREIKINNLNLELEKVVKERDDIENFMIEKWEGLDEYTFRNKNSIESKGQSETNKMYIIEDWTLDDEDDVCADKTVSSVNATQAVRSQADKSGNPEILLQDYGVVDSGCSSYMTGNKTYLSDYEDFNRGFYLDKHNMVAFLKKPNESVGFTEVVDFLKGTSLRTLVNGTQQLIASIDSKEYTITEASVRSKLQLADATGIHNLSNADIYAGLATLGYVTQGAVVDQGEGSTQPANPHLIPVDPIPSTSHSPHPSPQHQSPPHSPLHHSPYQSPPILSFIHTLNLSPHFYYQGLEATFSLKINSLEKELKDTKQTLGNAVIKLVKKVKTLETTLKRNPRKESMKEKSTDFVTPTKASGEAQEEELSPIILEAAKILSKVASQGVGKEKSTDKGKIYRRRARSMAKNIDTGLDAEEENNTGREEINTCIEEVSTSSTKVDSGTASKRGQREGKAPMVKDDI